MLKIKDLVSGYGSVQILNGANMKVDNQSIVALLGGNGTGKSTILKACSGIIRTWKGSINFNGEDIQNLPPHNIVEKGLVQVSDTNELTIMINSVLQENPKMVDDYRNGKENIIHNRKLFNQNNLENDIILWTEICKINLDQSLALFKEWFHNMKGENISNFQETTPIHLPVHLLLMLWRYPGSAKYL